jgi:hypothetical protein
MEDEFWGDVPSHWNDVYDIYTPSILPVRMHRFVDPVSVIGAWYSVRGGWTDTALETIRDSFASAIPGRVSARALRVGVARFVVYLGADRVAWDRPFAGRAYLDDAAATHERAVWAFNRGVQSLTGRWPDTTTSADNPLPLSAPPHQIGQAFARADSHHRHRDHAGDPQHEWRPRALGRGRGLAT